MCCPTLEARKYFSFYLSKGNLSQLFHLSVFVYEGLTRQKTTEFKVLYTLAQTIYLVFSSVQVTEVFLFVQWIQQWLIQTEPKLYREAGEFVLLLITISRKYILTTVRKIWFTFVVLTFQQLQYNCKQGELIWLEWVKANVDKVFLRSFRLLWNQIMANSPKECRIFFRLELYVPNN